MKYKEGDIVQIIDNTCGHGFKIGDEGTVVDMDKIAYRIENDKVAWWVVESNIGDIGTIVPEISKAEKLLMKLHYTEKENHGWVLMEITEYLKEAKLI